MFSADIELNIPVGGFLNAEGQIPDVLLDFRGVEFPADEAFDAEDGVFGVGDGLSFGNLPHQPLPLVGDRYDRRCGPAALLIVDNLGLAALHNGNTRIGRTQIDAYYFAHFQFLLLYMTARLKKKAFRS